MPTKFQQTFPGPQLTCVGGRREGELMRSPVRASRVLSVKCQWNVKCLSKTLSAFCALAASHVSWITGNWRMDPSTYQLPNSFLSGSQQAFTQPLHTATHAYTRQTSTQTTVFMCSYTHTHTDANVHTKHTHTHTHTRTHTHPSDTSWHSHEVDKRSVLVQNTVCMCVFTVNSG